MEITSGNTVPVPSQEGRLPFALVFQGTGHGWLIQETQVSQRPNQDQMIKKKKK